MTDECCGGMQPRGTTSVRPKNADRKSFCRYGPGSLFLGAKRVTPAKGRGRGERGRIWMDCDAAEIPRTPQTLLAAQSPTAGLYPSAWRVHLLEESRKMSTNQRRRRALSRSCFTPAHTRSLATPFLLLSWSFWKALTPQE